MRLALALALMQFTAVQAEPVIDVTKQIKCAAPDSVFGYFRDRHGETALWLGYTVHDTQLTLIINKETRSWTMIEHTPEMACVLAAGEEHTSSRVDF